MGSGGVRAFTPAFVLVLGSLLLYQGTRDQAAVPLAGRLDGILSRVDGYRVEDQRVSAEERRVAGMSDYVARMYVRPDSSLAFTTYVGYYERQTQGKTIHSPRNCLPGAGWEIMRAGTTTVTAASGPHVVNHYLLKNGTVQALVYYWYQGRGRVVANEYRVKLNLLRDAAFKGHTEEALVRIVVPLDPKVSLEQAYARADQLGAEIAPRLMDDVERVMPKSSSDAAPRVVASRSGTPR